MFHLAHGPGDGVLGSCAAITSARRAMSALLHRQSMCRNDCNCMMRAENCAASRSIKCIPEMAHISSFLNGKMPFQGIWFLIMAEGTDHGWRCDWHTALETYYDVSPAPGIRLTQNDCCVLHARLWRGTIPGSFKFALLAKFPFDRLPRLASICARARIGREAKPTDPLSMRPNMGRDAGCPIVYLKFRPSTRSKEPDAKGVGSDWHKWCCIRWAWL